MAGTLGSATLGSDGCVALSHSDTEVAGDDNPESETLSS